MSYTITLTDGSIFATIPDGTINTGSSMTLVGKNYAGYGQFINDDIIRLLENGSNTTAPGVRCRPLEEAEGSTLEKDPKIACTRHLLAHHTPRTPPPGPRRVRNSSTSILGTVWVLWTHKKSHFWRVKKIETKNSL